MTAWCLGFVFLGQEVQTDIPFSTFWRLGFGTPNAEAIVNLPEGLPLILTVLLGNLPQVLLSFIYLSYNDTFTCMLMSVEFARHAQTYKGLRVTLPRGEQRDSYTLSLPFKVSIPLMAASVVLHWAMSQSLFLAKVDAISPRGILDQNSSMSTLGWSPLALLIFQIMSGLMLAVLIASFFRKLNAGAPSVGSNSRAIMAASYALGDGKEEARKKVKYGVLGDSGRVGFGSEGVGMLEDGEVYE